MQTFVESSSSMAQVYIQEAERKKNYLEKRTSEEVAKIGTGEMPLRMTDSALDDFLRSLDYAAGLLGEDDAKVAALRKAYQGILAKNVKIAEARVAETRMIADKFTGKEGKQLKEKGQKVLKEAHPGITNLRTTVISEDWQEESVIEWTDTLRSKLRHRVTWSVSVQIAGKKDNEVMLYTIYIGKDRRSDGSWGPLQGHIMFVDPILEKNVNK